MTDVNDIPGFDADVNLAVKTLRKGGIILYPTDTVWGLGCDATCCEAVERIFALKARAEGKSMLVLADCEAMLERHVEEVPEIAYSLLEAAVNPLTIVYDKGRGLAAPLLGDDGSIGLRITQERFSKELCRRLRHPIVSTSANVSGEAAPRFFSEISSEIRAGVDYIPFYRRDDHTPATPSDIIRLHSDGEFKILRHS